MRRRWQVAVALVFLAAPAGARAQDPVASGDDTVQVRRVQDDLIRAYLHHDLVAIDGILADDYLFTTSGGEVLTKAQLLAQFKTGGDRVMTSYAIDDARVRVYHATAVLTYHYNCLRLISAHRSLYLQETEQCSHITISARD